MKLIRRGVLALALAMACQSASWAADSAAPVGEPVAEPATFKCLGAYWIVKGDDNKDAKVELAYRKVGAQDWKAAAPLFRVEKGVNKDKTIELGEDDWLFAGSIIDVPEATEYEMKLTLSDPDGGKSEKILKSRTIAEPVAPQGPTYHVVPGNGGGTGTKADPFKGIAAAENAAKPGDTFLLHAGKYQGPWTLKKSGEEGKPIVWKGAGDGEAIFEMNDKEMKQHLIYALSIHDVWFENIKTQGPSYSNFCLHGASRIVIRRCLLLPTLQGIYATKNEGNSKMGSFFISDNVIEGVQPWPATAEQWSEYDKDKNPTGIDENRGIWIGGSGNVVCYNRIRNCKDGIDTAETSFPEVAVDFHNNDVFNCYDDGSEMDGSHRNTRNFYNRYTNTLTGISFQPIYGGPVYCYRNVFYNIKDEFLKLHSNPSGAVIVHNTFVHKGPGIAVSARGRVSNSYSRNNLVVGTEGRALDLDLTTIGLDFDYDGFAGQSGSVFMRYNTPEGKFPYNTAAEVRANSAIEQHLIVVDANNLFASGIKAPEYEANYKTPKRGQSTIGLQTFKPETIDLRLNAKSNAVGAGQPLPGYNSGEKPDLGAYPVGSELPHYGPRK